MHRRDDEIFADAIALAAPERPAFVERVCGSDPALRARIGLLLAHHAQAESYFEKPLLGGATVAADEAPGTVIGRYTLVEKIGEGGCGVVWRAEQTVPVRRAVALKVIKPGMDSREVIARFEAERQALAMMEHPGIAKVFDAGATTIGRPYFVMELVPGMPITKHCDAHGLGLRARLDLFLGVCDAVQHAHQKGIIHRDLKPANVLVANDRPAAAAVDARAPLRRMAAAPAHHAIPKVIDFGIAKATEGRLTEATLHTAVHQLLGTPAYMSPEQVNDGNGDIDTRTDIYSLGALLYELLTGDTPFDRRTLSRSNYDEIREQIRTVEPERPSARVLRQTKSSAPVPPPGKGSAPATAAELRGDLDWIVLRCLEKDRARRYESAAALALDLRRHLEHEPVMARPPSAAYVFCKLVRRHRVTFAATAAIAAAIVLGAIVSTRQAVRATRAERAATASAREQNRLREEAETRRREEARRWSRSDLAAATRFLEQGRALEGLAFLVHAGHLDPENPVVGPRLLTVLGGRSFVREDGAPIHLPAPLQTSRYYGDLSPDGRVVGARGADGVFRLVNLETGRVAAEIPLGPDVTSVHNFHNNVIVQSGNESMAFHDPVTGALRTRWRPGGDAPFGSRGPSHEGRWAAMVHGNAIKMWDVVASQLTATIPISDKSRGLNFSPDGSRLGSIAGDGLSMRLWSVPDGRKQLEIKVPSRSSRIIELAVSHDNRTIALLHVDGVRLYDAATGAARSSLLRQDGHLGGDAEPIFTPDDKLVITASRDRAAHVWRVETGELAFPPLRHGGNVSRPQVAGNGRVLFTESSEGYRHLWDLTTGQPIVEPFHRQATGRMSLHPDGRQLVEVTPAGEIRRYRAEPNAAQPLALPPIKGLLGQHWVPDRPALLARLTSQRRITIDVATGREVGALDFPAAIATSTADGKGVYRLSGDGKVMVVRTTGGAYQAWTPAGNQVAVTPLDGFPVITGNGNVFPSEDGGFALVHPTSDAREVQIWNLRSGRAVTPMMPLGSQFTHASFSPDHRLVAAGTQLSGARVWEASTGRLVHELQPLPGARMIHFSPDGRKIATLTQTMGVRFWDAASGQPLGSYLRQRVLFAGFSSAGFSADGRWLMTYTGAGSVGVWNVQTGEATCAQIEHTTFLAATPAFSADGSRVVTCTADGTVRVWDARTGLLLAEPMAHRQPVATASFSPDGRFLLTSSGTQSTHIWAAPPAPEGPVPDWLLRLATLQAGMVVNDNGVPTAAEAEPDSWKSLRAEIEALPADAPYATWGKWIVARRDQRPLAPGFAIAAP